MGEVEVEAAVGLTPRVSSGDFSRSVTAFFSSFSTWEAGLREVEGGRGCRVEGATEYAAMSPPSSRI